MKTKTLLPALGNICEPVALPAPYQQVLITKDAGPRGHWLVGTHPDLSRLARELRTNEYLGGLLNERGARLGFRKTDVPPHGLKRRRGYEANLEREAGDHTAERKKLLHLQLSPEIAPPANRLGDWLRNVELYWQTQTPQAHHIVEYNNLRRIGISEEKGDGELDYRQLPCVLLMPEFHQRYISSYLKETHDYTGTNEELLAKYEAIYEELYFQQAFDTGEPFPFKSLGEITEVIMEVAVEELGSTKNNK